MIDKRKILSALSLLVVIVGILYACNKVAEEENAINNNLLNPPNKSSNTYKEAEKAIFSDKDFIALLDKVSFLMGKCVNSEVSAFDLSFYNTPVLCTQINMCEDDFVDLIDEISFYEKILSIRYNSLLESNLNYECSMCSMSTSEKVELLQKYISIFQCGEFTFDLKDYYQEKSAGGDDYGPCEHQLRALLCVTICTATLAEIPILMLACYYECLCTCCPNHPFCGGSTNQEAH